MATLSKNFRNPHSPSPIYGIRPGFNVGDLDRQYGRSVLVYGTHSWQTAGTGNTVPWPPQDATQPVVTQTSTADSSGTTVKLGARAVKISINVTGTGTAQITAITAADGSTVVFDSGALAAGTYEFYLGGWGSPSGDASNGSYIATQYGPVKASSSPEAGNTTGDEETTNPDIAADANYVGGTYNPALFLSLDGYDLVFKSAKVGTASWDVEVTPIS